MLDEELDIYDDLDQFQEAETKKCKELEAWEAKYNAARLEIESLQAEKKTLAKKIRTMEVNFQNLLDTAKAEIKRKDAQIIQLRKEKDDICFRRKQPPKSQIPPSSQIPELQQHQQSKRFKSDEMADRKTENAIAFNNQNENCDKKAKKHDNPEAKRHQVAQPIVRDGKERYKQERQEKQDMPLCSNPTTKVPWSVHIRSTHDRDREKQQERRRDRDHARGRSRRRSRSRSRSRSHSREHAKSRSQRQSSRSKDQRRKRSRSRSQYRSRSGSRSFNQTSSKNSKRNSSRETEKGPNAKCTAQSKRNKEDMMDTLFGSTPTQKSPSKDGKRCVDSQKVMENLLANVDPYTPIEQYTPQSQIEAKEEQQTHELIGKERQLLAEDINNYFERNVEKIKQISQKDDLDGVKGGSKLEDEEKRKSTSDRDASGETDFSKDEEMPDLILGVDELTNEATDNKITAENDDNQKIGNSFIAKLDVESEEADKQYCVTAEQLKSDANESFVTDKTEAIKTNTTNCDKDNNCEQAIDICHPERRQNMETTVNGSTMSQEPNPCQLAYARLAEENLKTPKRPGRSMESIQIIEDIRLPIKMDIENIADKVDGSNEKQTHTEDLNSNMREAAPTTSESEKSQLEIMAVNQNDSKSATVVTVNRPITPKLAVEAATVMYAQPDSTKIDHSEDDATLEAAMNELIPVKPQESYPNLSLEADTIEIALKQLHQAPCQSEDQPDETAVTSTSMKGGQTPKQDLIQILMQSPMQQTAEHSPIKPNKGIKQIVERTIRKRKSPSSENVESLTPDRREHTPLKKRTTDLRNEHIINSDDPSIPPTPPEVATTAKPSELNVTIDETCYASSLDQSQSLNSSDSLLVTKRCSLGNSDYQFERLNDEVVLRVTRRRRRRPAAEIAIIDDK
ncbi:hypothetical protein AWZ03_010268 [Drosophila navojoa]|uniref:Uncharacterized protein n=1 Tax=Drosophila navojoa TaxID=7232 RepID=A0A484B395_DRONA|nr:hypothetical protein AWZ03_010268 [Drosophila navojoa]